MDVRAPQVQSTHRRSLRPHLIVVGAVLVVAIALSGVSLIADPTSILTLGMAALYGAVGTLLTVRRPANPIGWLFLGVLLVFAAASAADGLGGTAVRAGAALPAGLPLLLIWVETWAYAALFGLYYALTLVFPLGRLPEGRIGRAVRISFIVPIAAVAASAFGPHLAGNFSSDSLGRTLDNPVALLPFVDGMAGLFEVATIGLLIGGIVSLIVRFRRARGIEREQLKWFVASLALTGAAITAVVAVVLAVPRIGTGIWVFAVLGYATIPPAIAVAVLRYRLYEIDRIVSRTVGWAVISAALAAVFVSVVLLMQALLASITASNTIAIAVSTLVVAALFQPLRGRVQARVDRRFNRGRYDAEQTMTGLLRHVRDEVDLGQLQVAISATVSETLQPASLALWLRE